MNIKRLNSKYILIGILAASLLLRLYRLDFPNKYVFDEVYHAFTAKEYLQGSKEAWEYWTTPPPGVAYEWTHPPLAKEIMTSAMFLFHSQDGWVWRLPGVLLGILSVFLVYRLGMILLKNEIASLIAAFAFSMDGLNFVQSRTGMNDIYFVTFILASLFFFLNKKYLISAIFVGLALSSKWTTFYIYLLYIPMLFWLGKKFTIIPFIIVPLIVYLITYIPFFLLGHSPLQFIQLQQQMWWYHTGLKATHGYASPWWSWPLNLYPVWYFVDYQKNSIANIFASGNPTFFWIGVVTMILTVWETIRRKSINLFIITLGFLVFWLPWAISPRIMFLYHYSPSVPFLALSLGHQLSLGLKHKESRKLVIVLLVLIILSFILIFPFLTAVSIPRDLVKIFFATNMSKNPF